MGCSLAELTGFKRSRYLLPALTGPDVTCAAIDAYGASLTAENIIEKFA